MIEFQCSKPNKFLLFGIVLLFCFGFTIPFVVSKPLAIENGENEEITTTNVISTTNIPTTQPPEPTGDKLERIRAYMQYLEVNAFLIPANDAHQSEYVGEKDRRVEFMSGFSGSNGYAIVTLNEAAIWVDGRYHLQVDKQVDPNVWAIMKLGLPGVPSSIEWLKDILKAGDKIGFDPFLTAINEFDSLESSLKDFEIKLVGVQKNLVDMVWGDEQPLPNITPFEILGVQYTGKYVSSKLEEVIFEITKGRDDVEAIILSSLDEIAWLFNLRAADITNTPVFYAYALITRSNGSILYIHENRMTPDVEKHFINEGAHVKAESYTNVVEDIKKMLDTMQGKILVPRTMASAINDAVPNERKYLASSPISNMKSVKNDVEAEGLRLCHVRDGAALIRYFFWLEQNIDKMKITEMSGADQLKKFRSEQDKFRGTSFGSISAVGPNAAIVHYKPDEESDRQITKDEVYLIDSGGQYLDGTTDVTRTIHLGQPSPYIKESYTRVLKGYIAIHTSIFPTKANGAVFDTLARRYLWNVGLDYKHGTGHGIGAYLGVHEFPPRFGQSVTDQIVANMFVSDEPGVYIEDQFGIRIEDIIQSVKALDLKFGDFGGEGALKFRPITLAPLQKKMIDTDLLDVEEIKWINNYHHIILDEVGDLLRKQNHRREYDWLVEQTLPLASTTVH